MRKRLLATFSTSESVIIWDNVVGSFDSASLAGVLTSPNFKDRLLGTNVILEVPNRSLFLLTGNNLSVNGDMIRRVMKCRIDPQLENPSDRDFEFDPLKYVLEHRQEMVAASLTIIRGWLSSGAARPKGRLA